MRQRGSPPPVWFATPFGVPPLRRRKEGSRRDRHTDFGRDIFLNVAERDPAIAVLGVLFKKAGQVSPFLVEAACVVLVIEAKQESASAIQEMGLVVGTDQPMMSRDTSFGK